MSDNIDINEIQRKLNQDKSLNNYTRELIMRKKMREIDGRGRNHSKWKVDPEVAALLRTKNVLNLGQFHRAYVNEFGFGYQKLYKIVKNNKEYLVNNRLITVKPAKRKVNKKTNKGNNLEMTYVRQDRAMEFAQFLAKFF